MKFLLLLLPTAAILITLLVTRAESQKPPLTLSNDSSRNKMLETIHLQRQGKENTKCFPNFASKPREIEHAQMDSWNVELVDLMEGGECGSVAIDGDIVYCNFDAIFVVIDISDTSHPEKISNLQLSGIIHDISLSGNYAYVIQNEWNGNDGWLSVIDITDPFTPVEIGTRIFIDDANSLVVRGNYAYITRGWEGLSIFDVSDPSNPFPVGSYHNPSESGLINVAVQGDYAYISEYSQGLRIIDISDPTNPFSAGSYYTGSQAQGVDVSGDYAYLSKNGEAGLWILDVSDPSNPIEAGTYYTTPGQYQMDVTVSGNYAYMIEMEGDVSVIDVSDPTNPTRAGITNVSAGNDIVISGDNVYVASIYEGLRVVDASNPANPNEIGSYDSFDELRQVARAGDYLCLTQDAGNLIMMDTKDPKNQFVLPSPHYGYTRDIFVSGTFAYLILGYHGWDSFLQIVDISNAQNPVEIGNYQTVISMNQVAVLGDYAYVSEYGPLEIIDISDKTNPIGIGSYGTSYDCDQICIKEGYLYLANRGGGLRILDINDPIAPVEVGRYICPANGVAVSDSFAYVAGRYHPSVTTFRVIDISDPTNPVETGSYDLATPAGNVSLAGNYVHLTGSSRLHVLDISNPYSPTEVGYFDTGGTIGCVAFNPPVVYAAAYRLHRGLFILQTDLISASQPALFSSLVLHQNYPNPFNPQTTISYAVPKSGHVDVRVYDVTGRLIRTLVSEPESAGEHRIGWEGRDASGASVASGVYFVRLETGGQVVTSKIVLLK